MRVPREIDKLIYLLFADEISAKQMETLGRWIAADPAHADLLVQLAIVEQGSTIEGTREAAWYALADLAGEGNGSWTLTPAEADEITTVLAEFASEVPAVVVDRTEEFERRAREKEERELARLRERTPQDADTSSQPRIIVIPTPVAWLGLAAAIILIAVVGYQFFETQTPPPASAPHADVPEILTEVAEEPQPVGRVSASSNAAWAGPAPDTGQLIADDRFELTGGMVELIFNDGGVVLIEAPAIFEATGPNAMRLLSGRLTANIPERAHGFTVDTPHLNVVDLGTEFGVEVDPNLASKADVFTGKIVATGLADQDDLGPIELTAGLAASANSRGELGTIQSADETRYYRSLISYIAAPAISGEGQYLSSAPNDVSVHALQSSDAILIFLEQAGLTWLGQLEPAESVGHGPAIGQPVDVFLVHFDPEPTKTFAGAPQFTRQTVLKFDRPILGLITDAQRLDQTDAPLGAPQTQYNDYGQSDRIAISRGLDNSGADPDTFSISSDGRTLTVTLNAYGFLDQMRVVVQASSP